MCVWTLPRLNLPIIEYSSVKSISIFKMSQTMNFKKLDIHPALLESISSNSFKKPTAIQVQAIPIIQQGRDILGIAKTGSGKTASFAIPILDKLLSNPSSERGRAPKVLVLVPTRELAVQVSQVFDDLSKNLPTKIKSLVVYGGVSINPQMKGMMGVEILIATPGRLLDLHRSNAVHLSKVEILVLDEADKMLNRGFQEEMESVLALLPRKRQNALFSATLSEQLSSINKVLLNEPALVKIENKEDDIELINLFGYFVSEERKGPFLRYLIKEEKMSQVLVFTSSGNKADKVASKLNKNGIQALSIHGKKSQSARMNALDRFKSGNLLVLVATDLISRGIDINDLPYVINYELPRSPKDFVHRVGRTGRANSSGKAISFVTRNETHHLKVILKKIKRYMDIIDSEEINF